MTAPIPELSELLRRAREAYPSADELAPGVSVPEAHVAAWHAVVVQGGFSSPEREAWRLSADRGEISRSQADRVTERHQRDGTETTVDTAVVNTLLQPAEAAAILADALARQSGVPVTLADTSVPAVFQEPVAPTVNERGEFTAADGTLAHYGADDTGTLIQTTVHEGAWLLCDGCNPVRVVDLSLADDLHTERGAKLAEARQAYADAKVAADAATEAFDAAKAKLRTALSEATNNAYRSELRVPGFKPVTLVYSEAFTLDTKRLKAEQPAVYVEFVRTSGRWTLQESRGKQS